MFPKKMLIFLAAVFLITAPVMARADEIWLSNGDHLTGRVVSMAAGKLHFETTYAGKIAVSWGEILRLQTETPIKIILQDGTTAEGKIEAGGSGKANVKPEQLEEPISFMLARVKEINPAPPGPAVKLKGRINIGTTVTRGNTETDSYYGDGELVARTKKNRFTLGGRFTREKDKGDSTVDNQTGYMKYDHFLTKKLYVQTNARGTKDRFKDLNLRTAFGVGLGYQFLETDRSNLSFEAGLSYVNEDYIEAEDDSFAAGRWALSFDHLLYRDVVQFFHFHEGLLSLEDNDDLTILSQTGLRFFFLKNFNATAQFNYDWDKSPSPGLRKADKTYLFTLGYQF